MLTQNGQNACPNCDSVSTTHDTQQVSKINKSLLPSQVEFLDFIMFHGIDELTKSLKLIHNVALYHSDVPFDEDEKSALFNLRVLWEGLERIEKEL